ncbi:MAG: flippase-like domain-containing protein [Nanoarchaeota archaeon]|nr:flippase-like domain-containing protein [Nanoarchaeota archaeon]
MFIKIVNFSNVAASIAAAGLRIILFLIVFVILNILVKALRWKILIKKTTGKYIGISFAFCSIFAGVASGSIFPGRNEITKPLMLKSVYDLQLTKTIPGSLIEKIFDLLAVILIFFIAIVFIDANEYNSYLIIFGVLALMLISLLFIFPKLFKRLIRWILHLLPIKDKTKGNLHDINHVFFDSFALATDKKTALSLYSLSLVAMSIEIIRLYYLFVALGIPINFTTSTLAFTGSTLFAILTLIPGGIGVVEFSGAFIITKLEAGLELNSVSAIFFLDRIISYYLIVGLGSIILVTYNKLFPNKNSSL